MARQRLKSAARLALEAPDSTPARGAFSLGVVVTNVAAGHALPTSLTELREVWIHVVARDAAGQVVFESGALDEHGEIAEGAIRFGSALVDAEGQPTFKPWEAADFAWKRTVPPKGSVSETLRVVLRDAKGPVTVEASLLYRIAPPHVIEAVLGSEAFEPEIVEMATATRRILVER
jgi:hypothetical protein